MNTKVHNLFVVHADRRLMIFLQIVNILFAAYILTVGILNRFALDDFAYIGILRDYGFLNPFTYWYTNWQGRFAPQFFLNTMYLISRVSGNLVYYPIILSSIFIYSINGLLRNWLPDYKKMHVFHVAVLCFNSFMMTSFDLSTFYWFNASVMYFGGVAFSLLGILFVVRNTKKLSDYVVLAIAFTYAGCSSENFGLLVCGCVVLSLLAASYLKYRSAPEFRFHFFWTDELLRRITLALIFSSLAFIVMITAPGTTVRMTQTVHQTDPFIVAGNAMYFTVILLAQIFFKLPYLLPYVPLFIWIGSLLPPEKFIHIPLLKALVVGCTFFLFIVFLSNIPIAYALGQVAPMRSYVYVNFFMSVLLTCGSMLIGFHLRQRAKLLQRFAFASLFWLSLIFVYTFLSETPQLYKYNRSVAHRMNLIHAHENSKSGETLYVPPLYNPQYLTITQLWRQLTHTDQLPTHASPMPLVIGEIASVPDWRNGHLKAGLNLKFDVYVRAD